MSTTETLLAPALERPTQTQARRRPWLSAVFGPPSLPRVSRRAFRFHLAYALLDATVAGILSNTPIMAVKALHATDAQVQIPWAMAALGFFASALTGVAMARRRKKNFILGCGAAAAVFMVAMACQTRSAIWFLVLAGCVGIFDFAARPAIPAILRIVYPEHCRSHVSGVLRQYASLAFMASTLLSAGLLQMCAPDAAPTPKVFCNVNAMMTFQLALAGLLSLAALLCFRQLPNRGDGSAAEAMAGDPDSRECPSTTRRVPAPPDEARVRFEPRFIRYLAIFFLYAFGNLFFAGTVAPFFAHDLQMNYLWATLFMHLIPALTAFLAGGLLTARFDHMPVWRSWAIVAAMWGADPVLLALTVLLPCWWPTLLAARTLRGPATVGSMVLAGYTGIHSFARPGPDTTRYMAVLFLVNGVARLVAPSAAACCAGHLSRPAILLCGGLTVLAASFLFLLTDLRDRLRGRPTAT